MSIASDPSVQALIQRAREEDLGAGDLSSSLLPNPAEQATFRLLAQEPGVLGGQEVAAAVLAAYEPRIELEWLAGARDGFAWTDVPADLALIRGPLASILSAERILLNFLQRLSGIATVTRRYVDAVSGTNAVILDTRKTIPGWRVLDKYAVRCGGGQNHRFGLYDAVLIKDNHIAGVATQDLAAAVLGMIEKLRALGAKPSFVEIEADTPDQAAALLQVPGVDVVLVDNFALADMREMVSLRDTLGLRGKVALEASGGITLATVGAVAQTGVDRISVGALTHSAPALNLSLDRA
jgi:nicotinate-nucleotide pyrophosphorylase (carboxylating)